MSFFGLFGKKSMVERIPEQEFNARFAAEAGEIIDVRTASEFQAGNVNGSGKADFLAGEFQTQFESWDKDKTYYLYCASGNRSGKAASMMKQAGFTKVYNAGGFAALRAAGAPTD